MIQHLADILETSSSRYPLRTAAIEANGRSIDYRSLHTTVVTIANVLDQYNIGLHDIGVIYMTKAISSMAAMLAIAMADSAYIIADSQAPPKRLTYILNHSRARYMISEGAIDDTSLLPWEKNIVLTVQINTGNLYIYINPEHKIVEDEQLQDLAFVLYTSGSTGHPKGVSITHRNACSFIIWCSRHFDISHEDVFSSIAPFHFDLSVFDIYVALLNGACVVLFNHDMIKNPRLLATYIDNYRISIWYSTPTLLNLMSRYGKLERFDHSSLRYVLFAGEVFHIDALRRIKSYWTTPKWYNLYGPTETNVVTWYQVPDIIDNNQIEPFPIGYACEHIECRLFDVTIRLPEPGMTGELVVAGDSVTPGYIGNAPKTNSTFIHFDQKTWYRTGDMVRYTDDHLYVYLGRLDRMVKRNGYRIELDEIEWILNQHPSISQAAVLDSNVNYMVRIYAFYCVETDQAIEIPEIKSYMQDQLPTYMIPDEFVHLSAMPMSAHHKIDYQALKPTL